MRKPRRASATAAFILAILAAPVGAQSTGQTQPKANASLEAAWVRAMPPTQTMTAGYVTFHNSGNHTLRIVGASSKPPARIEMHSSGIVDGMVTMKRLEAVDVAPGESVQFGPGGMHLMMMEIKRMPAPGEQLKLCLEIEAAAPVCTAAEVRKVAPSPDDAMLNHQHH